MIIRDNFWFSDCEKTKLISHLSFQGNRLDGGFVLEGDFEYIPDLTSTALSSHVNFSFNDENKIINQCNDTLKDFRGACVPIENIDLKISQFRRLKEICEQAQNHQLALILFAFERRFMRILQKKVGKFNIIILFTIIIDESYDFFSGYGRYIFVLYFSSCLL